MKLIVLDIDGVLSHGEARTFDLQLMARLAELNQRARKGEPLPAVTLNTGRPSAYVEAVTQAIDSWQPALFENGAGLYFPQTYQFQITPLLSPELQRDLRQIIDVLDHKLVQSGQAYWQPGKTVCYSLFAHQPEARNDVLAAAETIVGEISDQFAVTPAVKAINVHPKSVNKGSGLQWLAEVTDIDPQDMAGVGDSEADGDFLRLVGHPAAPMNATPDVKAVVQYIAPNIAAQGLHDILDHWHL